jgi:hypothetical protein
MKSAALIRNNHTLSLELITIYQEKLVIPLKKINDPVYRPTKISANSNIIQDAQS